MKWNSVLDCLPAIDDDRTTSGCVLGHVLEDEHRETGYAVVFYRKDGFWYTDDSCCRCNVDYWMKIPEME